MGSRRSFIRNTGLLAVGSLYMKPGFASSKQRQVGVQLYSVRKEMMTDAAGTIRKLAAIGYKELESARSDKGNYYGLSPKEIKKLMADLGMKIRSGHVHFDDNFQRSIDQAAEAGQNYLVCSSMPSNGQTVDNYKKVAEQFSVAGEQCKKAGLIFGYHNHEYEFQQADGKVLYDVLLEGSDPALVKMELDLGWAIAAGVDPLKYFEKYPGRFPLWHLKDMDLQKKKSTEFGLGQVNIRQLIDQESKSGMKHFFVEQEEYASTALESLQHDYTYLMKL